jgi:alanine racemase
MRAALEIDLDAIVQNARGLAARVAPSVFCAVVKSNAYGHGLVPVGKALSAAAILGIRFAVFSAEEGVLLRDAGIAAPILIVGPVADDELADVADAGIECPVLDETDAARYRTGTGVHVKVDTGVARFGIRPERVAIAIEGCRAAGLRVAGVYSHLANAEDLDEAFTSRQVGVLRSAPAPDGALKHIAASAAAIMWPQTRLDMVRCGISLFGHWPSAAVRSNDASSGCSLTPALRWVAPVVQTRVVAAGETVGYGCDFVAQRPTTVAVLPLGYADGLPRAAGGARLLVSIGAARAPVIGRICMNACMLDVTDAVPGVRRGDVALLDVDDVARAAGTINYEILARLPASLERRYTWDRS